MAQSSRPAPRPPDALYELPFGSLDEDTITTGVRYVTPPPDVESRDTDLRPFDPGAFEPEEETTDVMKDVNGMVRDALAPRPLPDVTDDVDFARALTTDPDGDTGFEIDLAHARFDEDKDK